MYRLVIAGGAPLHGEVIISGAKNAALPMMCAGLLTAETLYLDNAPSLHDISTMQQLLIQMGLKVERSGEALTLSGNKVNCLEAPYDMVKTMRAAILTLGPLVARFGEAKVSLPGGCAIGARPVDQHIKGLEALGADIRIEAGYIHAKAKKLKGARIVTDMITVTGTENLLMAATLAEGETILENAACEPEVVDLAHLLVAMGAKIEGIGTPRLVIQGVPRLHGARHTIISDRIEAATFLCAAAATRSHILLRRVCVNTLDAVLDKLREAGANIIVDGHILNFQMKNRPQAVSFRTTEYPGFPTDVQAQFMALNCVANGASHITETIFENRFMHVQELNRLGANIEISGHTAVVHGIEKLAGAPVMATDLRASASLVIAGLAAAGETVIDRIYHLDRGYDRMEIKLAQLGANIKRIQS